MQNAQVVSLPHLRKESEARKVLRRWEQIAAGQGESYATDSSGRVKLRGAAQVRAWLAMGGVAA